MTAIQFLWAPLYFLPALVWAIVAENSWRLLRTRRPRSTLFRLLPVLAALMAVVYACITVFALVPVPVHERRPRELMFLYVLADQCAFLGVAVFRHFVCYVLPLREEPPSGSWLVVNYGLAALLVVLAATYGVVLPGASFDAREMTYRVIQVIYIVGMLAWAGRGLGRAAMRGGWRAGGLGLPTRWDIVVFSIGMVAMAAQVSLMFVGGWVTHPIAMNLVQVAMGVSFALPIAMRTLGDVVQGVLVTGAMLMVVAAVYFGARQLEPALLSPAERLLLDLGAVLTIVVALVPGQKWLRVLIDRVVFRRTRRRRAELQTFLHTLSPELGARECCRRALGELARVWQLRGAALLLADGETLRHGEFAVEPLAHAWPRAELVPRRSVVAYELRDLPLALKAAILESDVVFLVRIASPRRHWGHLFLRTGLLGATYSEEDMQAVEAFADQLALVLDGTELLARAVAVERSLAHSEKLAAIGELSARIAHEIRNPVTAARSLAQQLCHDPTAPGNVESAALILGELERVERQVAALLRFARREEFRFESVDLGELARGTAETFRPRLEAAGIDAVVDAADAVAVRADREKLRQVLVNLIENAIDALEESAGPRRLSIAVGSVNGTATVRVADTGRGVPADALGHLFEPFFSLKASGTGLGLAIAKRTIDAHGGWIAAAGDEGHGMTFEVALPLGEAA